jgi:hypothetical protein
MTRYAIMIAIAMAFPASTIKASDQEECEEMCLTCVERGEDDKASFCMGLFQMCCEYYNGKVYAMCGCRTET